MGYLRALGPVVILLIAAFLSGSAAFADGPGMMPEHHPYGGYCQGPQWGWYGASVPVRTEPEARKYLDTFFQGQDIVVGTITTRGRHFVADILDKKGKLVDRVILDRRTGRVRSIF
jgi:hypothetical protein